MKQKLTVSVKRGANRKEEVHNLKPKDAVKLYDEVRAERKRIWPKVAITEATNVKTGAVSAVKVFEDDELLSIITPERIYIKREGEALRTFAEKQKKKRKKK